jgi:hypothetical protein
MSAESLTVHIPIYKYLRTIKTTIPHYAGQTHFRLVYSPREIEYNTYTGITANGNYTDFYR